MDTKRTKPYTNQEFFAELCKRVDLPRILDYSMASSKTVEIKSYECDFWNSMKYGTSEGIYLDIGLEFRNPERTVIPLGTFKTLDDSREAMREMARLLADMKLQSIPRSLLSGTVGIIRNTHGQRPFMKERADSRVAGYVIRTRNTM